MIFPVFSSSTFGIITSSEQLNLVNKALNYIFTFALLVDLFAILIISGSALGQFLTTKKETGLRSKELYIAISGFTWIALSFLWRLPFYLQGGFDLGFTQPRRWELEDNQFYYNIINNPIMLVFQVAAALGLFAFLFYQDRLFDPISDRKFARDLDQIPIGRATIAGVLNLVGVLLFLLGSNIPLANPEVIDYTGIRPNGLLLVLGLTLKVFIIPFLVISTSLRIASLIRKSKVSPSEMSLDRPSKPSILEQFQ